MEMCAKFYKLYAARNLRPIFTQIMCAKFVTYLLCKFCTTISLIFCAAEKGHFFAQIYAHEFFTNFAQILHSRVCWEEGKRPYFNKFIKLA